MNILVTGGAGYIGSHTVLLLLEQGHSVVVVDNLSNSSEESLKRVQRLTGKSLRFYQADILDRDELTSIFQQHAFDLVIHFAGLKAVGESVEKPWLYYQNNVAGTLVLLDIMKKHHVDRLIFSSSATVYGTNTEVPFSENTPVGGTTNPYGTSKLMIEQILQDIVNAEPEFAAVSLRYFNPVGAHISGEIGEDPAGIPNNLLPYISQVAVGKLPSLSVFGNDYPTKDGTGVRDYIHVMDLSQGHIDAMHFLKKQSNGYFVFNLGTGQGNSVLEVISTFEKVTGVNIPYQIKPRRSGDIAQCWADCSLAKRELNWSAKYSLDDMMADTWRWQQKNKNGYQN